MYNKWRGLHKAFNMFYPRLSPGQLQSVWHWANTFILVLNETLFFQAIFLELTLKHDEEFSCRILEFVCSVHYISWSCGLGSHWGFLCFVFIGYLQKNGLDDLWVKQWSTIVIPPTNFIPLSNQPDHESLQSFYYGYSLDPMAIWMGKGTGNEE